MDDQGRSGIDLSALTGSVGYRLRRVQIATFNLFTQHMAEFDIRPTQFAILTVIRDNPGLSQSQVSNALGLKRANLVPLLDGLEGRGLLVRSPSPADRRSYCLHLTDRGQEQMKLFQARHDQFEQELAAPLGPAGRTALLALLDGFHTNGSSDAGGDDLG
ncbi:MarR family winged helix-turn-helix transcriptional regulator [Niveispirillum irakense]|uniref:MarR family winged helix-turn-helix transcriptional regulator n=1 Tax=Niveispirillum irakense TaxID=34011 RepID=UPI000426E825|nr:MarR family transcriptional regulator [Niveispirillum irakense]